MADVSSITNYLHTASMGGGTFYGEVIKQKSVEANFSEDLYLRSKKQSNPALRDKLIVFGLGL